MSAAKVAITIEEDLLRRLDRVVRKASFPSRSRLARECAELDQNEERRMAGQGLSTEISEWLQY